MNISYACEEDKEEVKKLWQYCFTDEDEYVRYYFDKVYDKNNNLLLKKDSQILSSLMINPYDIVLNDKLYKTSYVVGVSAFPEHRSKGYTSKLMKNMLIYCMEKGEKVSMLMPIDTRIYTRYGYANIMNMLSLDLPLSRIEIFKDEDIVIKRQKDREYIEDMIKVYRKYSKNLDVFFKRDKDYMEKLLDEACLEGGHVFISYKDNIPCGYMIFYPKYSLGKSGFIREIIADEVSGAKALLSMVASHYTQIENVVIDLDENSNIRYIFNDDNKIKYSLRPFMMSRILDAKSVLEDMDIKEDISIKIKDEIIEKNNFVFSTVKGKNSKTYDIELDIYDLARLVFGAEDPQNLLFGKNIKTDDETLKKLKRIFFRKRNYFNDYV